MIHATMLVLGMITSVVLFITGVINQDAVDLLISLTIVILVLIHILIYHLTMIRKDLKRLQERHK
jgi:hypothetical protein